MFKSVSYDKKTNKVTLWELDENGKTKKHIIDYNRVIYLEDKTESKENCKYRSIYGEPLYEKQVESIEKVNNLKDMGFKLYQSDIAETILFLQDRYYGKSINPDIGNFNVATMDIEIEAGDEFPTPEEANYPVNLISVHCTKTDKIMTWGNRPFTGSLDDIKKIMSPDANCDGVKDFEYRYIENETDLLEDFMAWWRKSKIDILTGWNVKDFDMNYLLNRKTKLGIEKQFSPINGDYWCTKLKKVKDDKGRVKEVKVFYCTIPGLTILDYLELYKKFTFDTLESYSLNFVSTHEKIGGKLDLEGQVNNAYKTDWNKFVIYNIQDIMLPIKMEHKKKFIQLAIRFCSEALVPMDMVFSSIAVITGFILKKLKEKNLIIPDRDKLDLDWWREDRLYVTEDGYQNIKEGEKSFKPFSVKGGHVEANPGLYKYLLSYDVESLYPHNIIQFNVSPETKVYNPTKKEIEEQNLIKTPLNGIYYKRERGILPEIVEGIFNERRHFKKLMFKEEAIGNSMMAQYYDSQQHIRKILINSMYGVLGNKYFHFYDVDNARVITRAGRNLIRFLSSTTNRYIKEMFHKKLAKDLFPNVTSFPKIERDVVVVVDTDSNYLCLEEIKEKYAKDMDFAEFAEMMDVKLFKPFFTKILKIYADKFKAPNVINFKREGVILKQFVLAKKKYLTLLIQNEDKIYETPKLKATGVEIKRSDTPIFCRGNIETVVKHIFDYEDKDKTIELLKTIKKEFSKQPALQISSNSGVKEYTKYSKNDDVFIKNNRIEYKSSTPIHVRASMNYNFMIKKLNLPYVLVGNGTKIKYVYIKNKNTLDQDVIAFVGKYPEEFKRLFKIDYDLQFTKTFLGVIQRMFDVLDWGDINLKDSGKLKLLFE